MGPRPPRVRVSRRDGVPDAESALRRRGLGPVAGVDEAGRGACAGPLVVAACVLGDRGSRALAGALAELDDSKRLSPAVRERLYGEIVARCQAWSVVVSPAERVDALGVHRCDLADMRRATWALGVRPGYVLVDGFPLDGLAGPALGVIGGDAACPSIAAASVLAKVTRDRIMVGLDSDHPGYGLAGHKGYGTAAHMRAVEELGPSPVHRRSYANVQRAAQAYARRQAVHERRGS